MSGLGLSLCNFVSYMAKFKNHKMILILPSLGSSVFSMRNYPNCNFIFYFLWQLFLTPHFQRSVHGDGSTQGPPWEHSGSRPGWRVLSVFSGSTSQSQPHVLALESLGISAWRQPTTTSWWSLPRVVISFRL